MPGNRRQERSPPTLARSATASGSTPRTRDRSRGWGNSASYGLDLLANGIRWRSGDEVLLVDGDFPADVHPWRVAEPQGVTVRLLRPAGPVVQPEELAGELRGRTRLFCTSWVSSFNGHAADTRALGQVCRDAGVTFVLNLSQALGARRLEIASLPVDAVTCCGYKWLCGPYGTGFCWLDPRLRESLAERHAYWLAMHAGRGFDRIRDYTRRHDLGARAWDVFCPASFFNVMPWLAAIEYLLQAGGERIERHDQELVGLLLERLRRGDPWRPARCRHRRFPARRQSALLPASLQHGGRAAPRGRVARRAGQPPLSRGGAFGGPAGGRRRPFPAARPPLRR